MKVRYVTLKKPINVIWKERLDLRAQCTWVALTDGVEGHDKRYYHIFGSFRPGDNNIFSLDKINKVKII